MNEAPMRAPQESETNVANANPSRERRTFILQLQHPDFFEKVIREEVQKKLVDTAKHVPDVILKKTAPHKFLRNDAIVDVIMFENFKSVD